MQSLFLKIYLSLAFLTLFCKVELKAQTAKSPLQILNEKGHIIEILSVEPRFSEGLAQVILRNESHGFMDTTGKLAFSFLYYRPLGEFKEGLAPAALQLIYLSPSSELNPDLPSEQNVFIDKNGKIAIDAASCEEIYAFSEGLARVKMMGKFGFIDKNGKMVIPPIYDWAEDFAAGEATVNLGGTWNYINTKGQIVSIKSNPSTKANLFLVIKDKTTGQISKFSANLALEFRGLRYDENILYGLEDKTGKTILPTQYGGIDLTSVLYWEKDFGQGKELIGVSKNEKKGLIDKTGKIILPFQYNEIMYLPENHIFMIEQDEKIGIADKTGKMQIPLTYDDIRVEGDLVFLMKEESEEKGTTDVLNNAGKKIISYPSFFSMGGKFKDLGECFVIGQGQKVGLYDKNGKVLIPLEYEDINPFMEGLAGAKKGGKWGFMDKTAKTIIPFEYEDLTEKESVTPNHYYDFREGFASAKKNGKWGFINKTGKAVIPFEYEDCKGFFEGLAAVKQNGKWGFVDKTGKLVIPCEYESGDELEDELNQEMHYIFSEGLAAVKQNDKWGFIDKTGKLVIPFEFKVVRAYFCRGEALVGNEELHYLIDKSGKKASLKK